MYQKSLNWFKVCQEIAHKVHLLYKNFIVLFKKNDEGNSNKILNEFEKNSKTLDLHIYGLN